MNHGYEHCPSCKEVVVNKTLPNYSQVECNGVPGKRRKIVHLEEDAVDACTNVGK